MFSKINEALTALFVRFRGEEGQTLSEYGLIIALVAIVCIVALGVLAGGISTILNSVGATLTAAA